MWKGVRKAKQRLGPAKGQYAGGSLQEGAQQIGEGQQGNQTGNGLLCQHLPVSQSPEPKSKQELVEVKGL